MVGGIDSVSLKGVAHDRGTETMSSLRTGILFLTMRSLLTLVLAIAALVDLGERASAQGAVKSVHNDWQVRCDTPPGAQGEQCALMQSVTAEDRANVGRAGFVRCLPNGCVAEVVMDDNLVKQLRSGQVATFIIFQTPEEGIGFPMSLKGFGEGYDKLP